MSPSAHTPPRWGAGGPWEVESEKGLRSSRRTNGLLLPITAVPVVNNGF
jgi:hypothetical protein